jgi:S-disulfanyl-L-cysteine oxidoreductase SoxD
MRRPSASARAASVLGAAAVLVMASALRAEQAEPAPKSEETAAGARSVWDGVYTEAQAKRGEALYRQSCSTCHGDALLGREMASPLTGPAFNSNWNGVMLGDLMERMRLTMPQTSPGSLSRQENADVLAYILSVGGFPAGEKELARQTEILNTIRYLATKP